MAKGTKTRTYILSFINAYTRNVPLGTSLCHLFRQLRIPSFNYHYHLQNTVSCSPKKSGPVMHEFNGRHILPKNRPLELPCAWKDGPLIHSCKMKETPVPLFHIQILTPECGKETATRSRPYARHIEPSSAPLSLPALTIFVQCHWFDPYGIIFQ